MAKRNVILPIPSDPKKAAALRATAHAHKSVPGGKLTPGRVYAVDEQLAAHLVAKKGYSYAGPDGKPTDERPNYKPEIRKGTREWLDAELQKRIEEAKLVADPVATETFLAYAEEDYLPEPIETTIVPVKKK